MKHPLLLALLILASLGADELSFGTTQINTQKIAPIQSLQIHSSKTLEEEVNSLKRIPPYHRQYIGIYQVGEYYATRYANPDYPRILPWIIRDFKKAGFESSFTLYPNPNAIPLKTLSHKNSATPVTASSNPTLVITPQPLTQHEQTRLILDAKNAYEKHDYSQATTYYEMMLASGIKDRQVLLNLCYLYGREGSSVTMEKLIEGKRGINDYLYAYGVGALEAGHSDLYSVLSPHLLYDKSGRLAMLCGYFFEQEKNSQRAASFYKMAYETAPNNPHILYAYARSADISGEREKALALYAQLSQLSDEFEPLRFSSQLRIRTLRGIQ